MFKNALISVSDKTGLVDLVKPLAAQGTRIVSTGGTYKFLRDADIKVTEVSEQTHFPEALDGRVKTLHPFIHMALLCRQHVAEDCGTLASYELEPFDLVVGNLYPFEQALTKKLDLREQCEFIDIGGPSMLRAAAKNFEHVVVVCDPSDYAWLGEMARSPDRITLGERKKLAAKVFYHAASYDAVIAEYLGGNFNGKDFAIGGEHVAALRYGENPQQRANWYRKKGAGSGLHQAHVLQGSELSYNNILDLDAACRLVRQFGDPCAVAVKHNNPCGVAVRETIAAATAQALGADPISVFGGIVALNRTLDVDCARELSKLFLSCVIAPEVSPEAVKIFSKKKKLIVAEWPDLVTFNGDTEFKSVAGGVLIQSTDQICSTWNPEWKIIGPEPDSTTKQDLLFAWKVCALLKSNAIAVAKNQQSLGLGMGQVNRVDAVKQAIERWQTHHAQITAPILASDAFFPFADSVEIAAKAGIIWVIQPGGSVRDDEVISKARELNVNLVLTSVRHFRH